MPDDERLDTSDVKPITVSKITDGTVVIGTARTGSQVFDKLRWLANSLEPRETLPQSGPEQEYPREDEPSIGRKAVIEVESILEYVEGPPFRLLRREQDAEVVEIILEIFQIFTNYFEEWDSRFGNVRDAADTAFYFSRVTIQLGVLLLECRAYRIALDAFRVAEQAAEILDEDDRDALPDIDRNVDDCYLGIINEHIKVGRESVNSGDYKTAVSEYESALQSRPDHLTDDKLASELRDEAWRGRANAHLEAVKHRVENANAHLEGEEYEAAIEEYRSAIDYADGIDQALDDGVVQEQRRQLEEFEDYAQRGCTEARARFGKRQLEDATSSFEKGEYEISGRRFRSAIEHLGKVDNSKTGIDDEWVVEAITTAREGFARARIEQNRAEIGAATARFEDGAYRETRDRFTEIRERLEELRSFAADYELANEVATIESLIEDCEAGVNSARRALIDIDGMDLGVEFDTSPDESPEVALADDALGIADINQLGVDIPSVTDDMTRPAGSLVEPDLLTELPDREEMELVGRGGNAQVFKLVPPGGSEPVATKVPLWRGDETLDRAAMEDFVREALIWNKIDDEHIVKVQHVGTEPYPWIQMEYMDAGTLADRVGEVGLEEAVRLLTVLCETIGEVHQNRGIHHADLKPSNILFRTDADGEEEVKVADWGTARVLFEHSTSMEELTPKYAAPEQVNSDRFGHVDSYTDIYQLGVVAYELLTGQVPFDYRDPGTVLRAIEEEEPPPPSSVVDLPSRVDEVIQKALNKEKGERYESLRYFRDGLNGVVE